MSGPSGATEGKDLVRRFARVLGSGDVAELDAIVAPSFVLVGPTTPTPMSRDEVARAIEEVAACFSDREHRIEELVAEGDRVVARYRISGTQRADYHGIRSRGRRFTIDAVSLYRIEHGRIVEEWEIVDRKSFVAQLDSD